VTGTLINISAILVGSFIGMVFGARLSDRVRETVIAGLGLFTSAIGVKMFLEIDNPIVVLGALLIGGGLGEWWRLETRLQNLGRYLENSFTREGHGLGEDISPISLSGENQLKGNRFIRGFLTASLVFCIGPMTILGAIQDGLTGDYGLLAIKAVLDGFASIAFASSLGIGVMFSTLVVLIFQGGISLLAAQATITNSMMNEMTSVGGLLLLGLGISSLLEIKPIRVGNFLPALFIAPFIVAIISTLGIG
jgi:uncharacterized membrane protein YqgA involved in biofilm formation